MDNRPRRLFFSANVDTRPNGANEIIDHGDNADYNVSDSSDYDEDVPYENPQTGERSGKRQHSTSTRPEQPAKKVRFAGGKAPIPKPVTEDYDSDDARIIELKTQGYTDEIVAAKLLEEGRIRYVPKTISSRWTRLRKITEKKEDDRLDDELSDWHIGEDDYLDQSLKAVDKKFELEVQKLMDKKWKEVSINLADHMRKKKYTGKACKERWEALLDGSALKAIEIDSDQDGRKIKRETRITEAKRRRAEEKEEVKRAEEAKEWKRLEKKRRTEAKYQERVEADQARKAEKAETARIRHEKKIGKQEAMEAEIEARKLWKAAIEDKRNRKALENRIYRDITGKNLIRVRRRVGDDDNNTQIDSDDDRDSLVDDEGETDDDVSGFGSDRGEDQDGKSPNSDAEDDSGNENTAPPPPTRGSRPRVTAETLLNPRSVMTEAELEIVLHERKLPKQTMRESHPQLVARLAAADQALDGATLDRLLGKFFDKSKGNKQKKILRLQQNDASKSAAGSEGVKSTDLQFKKRYEGYGGEYAGLICDEIAEK